MSTSWPRAARSRSRTRRRIVSRVRDSSRRASSSPSSKVTSTRDSSRRSSPAVTSIRPRAKGIGYAHFTGPGLPSGGITIHGYFDALSLTGLTEPKMPVPHLSRAQLGPAYPATYHVDYAPHPWLHQVLYPYAKGGPVTFTP